MASLSPWGIFPGDATSVPTLTEWDTITADQLQALRDKAAAIGQVGPYTLYCHPSMKLPDVIPDDVLIVKTTGVSG